MSGLSASGIDGSVLSRSLSNDVPKVVNKTDDIGDNTVGGNNGTGKQCKSFKNWFKQRQEQAKQQQQLDDQLVSAKLKADWVHMTAVTNTELPSLATRHYNELKTTLNESLRFHDVFGHERFGYTSSIYNETDNTRDAKSTDNLITSTMDIVATREYEIKTDETLTKFQKQKFSSTYWREWKKELELLQDVSREKIEEETRKNELKMKKIDENEDYNEVVAQPSKRVEYDFALPPLQLQVGDDSAAPDLAEMDVAATSEVHDSDSIVTPEDSVQKKVRHLLSTGKTVDFARKGKPLKSSNNMRPLDERDNNSVSKHFRIFVAYQLQKQEEIKELRRKIRLEQEEKQQQQKDEEEKKRPVRRDKTAVTFVEEAGSEAVVEAAPTPVLNEVAPVEPGPVARDVAKYKEFMLLQFSENDDVASEVVADEVVADEVVTHPSVASEEGVVTGPSTASASDIAIPSPPRDDISLLVSCDNSVSTPQPVTTPIPRANSPTHRITSPTNKKIKSVTTKPKPKPKPRAEFKAPVNYLQSFDSPNFSELITFGFGCSRQEHVLYGMCLDGMCGRRATHELTALTCNDITRFGGFEVKKSTIPSSVDKSNVSMALSLIDDPTDKISALHMAVYLNDVIAIEKLHHVRGDVNIVMKSNNPLNYSLLHLAVKRRLVETVEALIVTFESCLELDPIDSNGDTPLHIASRDGEIEIVKLLCDAGSTGLVRNHKNLLPSEVAKTHPVYQIIQLSIQKNSLLNELKVLKTDKVLPSISHTATASPVAMPVLEEAKTSKYVTSLTSEVSSNKNVRKCYSKFFDEERKKGQANMENKLKTVKIDTSALNTELEDARKHSYIIGYLPRLN